MSTEIETVRVRDQKNKPGEKVLTVKIPERVWRTFRSRAMANGVTNAEYFVSLVEGEQASRAVE